MIDAAALRADARRARRALSSAARDAAQALIVERLLGLSELVGGPTSSGEPASIALYLPTDGEVDLHGGIDTLRARGWQLLLPVIGDERRMALAPWRPDTRLTPNRFGVLEPSVEHGTTVAPGDVHVVVLPCVAVDRAGHRLGFGAGYYDRALAPSADLPLGQRPLRVGVAFDVQLVGHIDAQPWDVPLDVVVTDAVVLRPG